MKVAVDADALGGDPMVEQPPVTLDDGRFQFDNALAQGEKFGCQGLELLSQQLESRLTSCYTIKEWSQRSELN